MCKAETETVQGAGRQTSGRRWNGQGMWAAGRVVLAAAADIESQIVFDIGLDIAAPAVLVLGDRVVPAGLAPY